MNYENLGYAIGQLMGALFMCAVVVVVIVMIVRSRASPAPQPATATDWNAGFGLLPGEYWGVVWQAAHTLGHPMWATITSTGVFALNYVAPQAPPLRMRPEGVTVSIGAPSTVTPGAAEPMADVTLSVPDQSPLSFRIALSGAKALAAWAKPSS